MNNKTRIGMMPEVEKWRLPSWASDGLRALSFICALMVVTIHSQSVAGWFRGDAEWSLPEALFIILFTDSISRIAVPFFFFVSGFFLALDYAPMHGKYTALLKKKLMTVLCPFVVWNMLNVVLMLLTGRLDAPCGANALVFCSEKIFGWNPVVTVGCKQFWYLQCLMLVFIASPLLTWVAVRLRVAVAGVAILFCLWCLDVGKSLPYYLHPKCFLWLMTGMMIAVAAKKREFRLMERLVSFRGVFLVVFAISVAMRVGAGCIRNVVWYGVADKAVITSGVVVLLLYMQPISRIVRGLKSCFKYSFFIYAFHTISISIFALIASRLSLGVILEYILCIFFVVTTTLIAACAMERFAPKTLRFLCGGR